MIIRHLHLRLDRLVRDRAFGSIRCSACRNPDPSALDGLLRISSPLPGPDGVCLFHCIRCRQFYRGQVVYVNGIPRVDNVVRLCMPN